MTEKHSAEHLFHGPIAEEYGMLKLICPAALEMSRRVGEFVGSWRVIEESQPINVLEIGCGTGLTTAFLLAGRGDIKIACVDNAPAMLSQARQNLAEPLHEGRLSLIENDALSYLQEIQTGSIGIVASAYTLHNFLNGYRSRVLEEIFRVLKPNGLFINGDRYAVDDCGEHLRNTQNEVREYFRVFLEMKRPDLLEQWIVHLFSDESEEHIMRLQPALDSMNETGFRHIGLHFRSGTNALVSAVKPN